MLGTVIGGIGMAGGLGMARAGGRRFDLRYLRQLRMAHRDRRAEFLALTGELRPELHRYCARLMGSVIESDRRMSVKSGRQSHAPACLTWANPERSIRHCCQMPNKAATAGGGATLTAHRPRRRAIDGPGAPG